LIKKSIKIPRKFWKKLLSYPITAFGYSIGHPPENKELPNPKFDRTDVIKALDFWIDHWVYQNKKDYILEGTVNKDFELTVRELIETREAVLKCPVDTKFVRQKIRVNEVKPMLEEIFTNNLDKKKHGEQMIEFTENVLTGGNNTASTVDQFCYVVRKMTYKEYMERQYELYTYNINFRGNNRFDFGTLTNRTLNTGENTITDTVPTELEAFEIRGPDHLLHSNLHPSGIPTFEMVDREEFRLVPAEFASNHPVTAVGRAGEELQTSDLIMRNENDLRWYKATGPITPSTLFNVLVNRENVSSGGVVFALPHWKPIVPSGTEQEIRTIIERGRLLGLNEQAIRDSIEITTGEILEEGWITDDEDVI
jgi:hypothetical protein